MPKMPKAQSIIVTVPPLNSGERNSVVCTIAWVVRDSTATNAAAAMAASAKAPRMTAEVQPLSWPSISA